MMPGWSCSGVKLTEDSVPAVSHGTLRRMTSLTKWEGLPYGRSTTPGPSDCDHGASCGGKASACAVRGNSAPPAKAVPMAAPTLMNVRRPE